MRTIRRLAVGSRTSLPPGAPLSAAGTTTKQATPVRQWAAANPTRLVPPTAPLGAANSTWRAATESLAALAVLSAAATTTRQAAVTAPLAAATTTWRAALAPLWAEAEMMG